MALCTVLLEGALAPFFALAQARLEAGWFLVWACCQVFVKAVLGGIQLNTQRVIAQFFGARLDLPSGALIPTMLAAATQGVVQAAQTQWYFQGGDLATTISQGLEVLETGIGTDPKRWSTKKSSA